MKRKSRFRLDLFVSLSWEIITSKKTWYTLGVLFFMSVGYSIWKVGNSYLPEKEISFQVVNGNARSGEAVPIQGALVTLQVSGKKVESSPTRIDGRVYFSVKESDECTGLTVEMPGYDSKPVLYPALIPKCFNLFNTTIIPLRKKNRIPEPPPVIGLDSSGKKATFKFTSLLTKYTWAYGKSNELAEQSDSGERLVNAESTIQEELSHLTFKQDIENSKTIVAVGLSSCEGITGVETKRAQRRAGVIKEALTKLAYKPDGDILMLILGQYQDENCSSDRSSTALQRRLLIIRVTQQDLDVNLDEAVNNALSVQEIRKWLLQYLAGSTSPLKTLDINKYSDIFKVRLIP
jgi:hypothetical protein